MKRASDYLQVSSQNFVSLSLHLLTPFPISRRRDFSFRDLSFRHTGSQFEVVLILAGGMS